jgi:hypothetical protein
MGGFVMLIVLKDDDSLWSKTLFVVGPGLSFDYFCTMLIMSAYVLKKQSKKNRFIFKIPPYDVVDADVVDKTTSNSRIN